MNKFRELGKIFSRRFISSKSIAHARGESHENTGMNVSTHKGGCVSHKAWSYLKAAQKCQDIRYKEEMEIKRDWIFWTREGILS